MTQVTADPSTAIVVAVVSGLFALLGGFFGAWLARRTEYDKWLRQERSTIFAEFLRGIHGVRMKSTDIFYNSDFTEQQRDLKITELFVELDSQECILRLYLKSNDRHKLSELKKELWLLYSPTTSQSHRMKRCDGVLSEIQEIFEETLFPLRMCSWGFWRRCVRKICSYRKSA
jgi:hypothetical protein